MRFTHISLAPACRWLVSQKHEIPSSPFPKIQGSHCLEKSIHFRSVFPCKFPFSPLPSQFSISKKSPKKQVLYHFHSISHYSYWSWKKNQKKKTYFFQPPGMNWKQSRYRWAKFFTLLLLVIFDILQFTLTADFLGRLDGKRWGLDGP